MKILIIKPSSLGDVVQTLPVLRLLRRHWPDAQIAWCIAEGLIPLLEKDPDLNEIIPFQRKGWNSLSGFGQWRRTILELRQRKFDLVIDLQSLLRSGLIAWLANGTTTAGLDLRREGASLFYDVAVPRPTDRPHAVDWYLAVLRELGVPTGDCPEVIPPRADIQKRLNRIRRGSDKPLIALIPGARWDNKRWPAAHFATLAKELDPSGRRYDFAILGAREDRPLATQIMDRSDRPVLDL
ncbi:MAG: glycosyltransferase family 9 protein, partial [Limisphaerales bacterium]